MHFSYFHKKLDPASDIFQAELSSKGLELVRFKPIPFPNFLPNIKFKDPEIWSNMQIFALHDMVTEKNFSYQLVLGTEILLQRRPETNNSTTTRRPTIDQWGNNPWTMAPPSLKTGSTNSHGCYRLWSFKWFEPGTEELIAVNKIHILAT